jgi:glycerophosphoryl diester phosphodiesterase
MKKTFPLHVEGKNPARLLEATKHEIRKYIKRERRRDLPVGVDFWDFDCRFGTTPETASVAHIAELIPLIDALVQSQGTQFYIEILSKHGHRQARQKPVEEDIQAP